MTLLVAAHPLVHVNALLNSLATVLLIVGLVLIKRGNEVGHKRVMLTAMAVSIAFLSCYLYYHSVLDLTTPFEHEGPIRYLYYYFLLPSHVILAMTVPPLAVTTILLGLRAHGELLPASVKNASALEQQEYIQRHRIRHRRWAKVTFPVWLYVSVTGVVVYWMLYQL